MSDLLSKHPKLKTFEDLPKKKRWEACLDALNTDYTTSIKQACQILKCSRSWTTKYIKPHCRYIYLEQTYSRIAAMALNRKSLESVWLNSHDFESLIKSSIQSCSRQTIQIPVEYLVEPKRMAFFRDEYKRIDRMIDICKEHREFDQIVKLINQKDDLLIKAAKQEGQTILKNQPSRFKRSNSEAVSCDVPAFELSQLKAVHDLKEYGDTDEIIYRNLFLKGSYRLEIGITDQDGVVSKKVYYLYEDEVDPIDFTGSVGQILIKYSDFAKYKNVFTKEWS